MDYKNIISLIKEMNQTDLTKLEIEEEGIRICIEKSAKEVPVAEIGQLGSYAPIQYLPANYLTGAYQPQSVPSAVINTVMTNTGTENQTQNSTASSSESQSEENCKKQVSPMVGTFYTQPSPDKPPFVKVGDKVKKGQTLCIIEAMKLMNEIESEHDGEVIKVLTQNEAMVEYGQPLFLIK